MIQSHDILAQTAMTTLSGTFMADVGRAEITHDERLQLMDMYANGASVIIRALRTQPATRTPRPSVDDRDEVAVVATEAAWLLLEAHAILLEVDSDRAKAWLERYTGDNEHDHV